MTKKIHRQLELPLWKKLEEKKLLHGSAFFNFPGPFLFIWSFIKGGRARTFRKRLSFSFIHNFHKYVKSRNSSAQLGKLILAARKLETCLSPHHTAALFPQSVEHETLNLRFVGSSLLLGDIHMLIFPN